MCLCLSEGEHVAAGSVVLEAALRYHHVSSASRAQGRPEEAVHTPTHACRPVPVLEAAGHGALRALLTKPSVPHQEKSCPALNVTSGDVEAGRALGISTDQSSPRCWQCHCPYRSCLSPRVCVSGVRRVLVCLARGLTYSLPTAFSFTRWWLEALLAVRVPGWVAACTLNVSSNHCPARRSRPEVHNAAGGKGDFLCHRWVLSSILGAESMWLVPEESPNA